MKEKALEKNSQIACPRCGHDIILSSSRGNTIATPIMCDVCGCSFVPKFYCPEEGAAHGHIFESENLYLDNQGVYMPSVPSTPSQLMTLSLQGNGMDGYRWIG